MHERRQRVGVGVPQLLDLAVAQQRLDDRVLLRQLLQRVGVGGRARLRLLDRRQPELLEQDAPELRRGVDVELLTGVSVDLGFEPPAVVAELLAELLEESDVDPHAGVFHLREDGDERTLDALVQLDELAGLERLGQRVREPHEHRDPPTGLARRSPRRRSRACPPPGRVRSARATGSAGRDLRGGTSLRPDRGGTP